MALEDAPHGVSCLPVRRAFPVFQGDSKALTVGGAFWRKASVYAILHMTMRSTGMDKGDGMPGSALAHELQILQGQPAHLGQCVAQALTAPMHQRRAQRDPAIPGQHSATQPVDRPLPASLPLLIGVMVPIRAWRDSKRSPLSPPVLPQGRPDRSGSSPFSRSVSCLAGYTARASTCARFPANGSRRPAGHTASVCQRYRAGWSMPDDRRLDPPRPSCRRPLRLCLLYAHRQEGRPMRPLVQQDHPDSLLLTLAGTAVFAGWN